MKRIRTAPILCQASAMRYQVLRGTWLEELAAPSENTNFYLAFCQNLVTYAPDEYTTANDWVL